MNRLRLPNALLLSGAILALAACAGTPFSTLWHYRNFGPRDFLETDASALRAALQLQDGVSLGTKSPELDVKLQVANGTPQTFVMPLAVLKEGPWVGAGTGKAESGKHWYLLALSDTGVGAYRRLQQTLNGDLDASGRFKKHGSLTVSVQTNQLRYSHAAKERLHKTGRLFLQVRLELSAKDGFYTLYKGELKTAPHSGNNAAD